MKVSESAVSIWTCNRTTKHNIFAILLNNPKNNKRIRFSECEWIYFHWNVFLFRGEGGGWCSSCVGKQMHSLRWYFLNLYWSFYLFTFRHPAMRHAVQKTRGSPACHWARYKDRSSSTPACDALIICYLLYVYLTSRNAEHTVNDDDLREVSRSHTKPWNILVYRWGKTQNGCFVLMCLRRKDGLFN